MEKLDIEKLMHDLDKTPWVEIAEKVNEIVDYVNSVEVEEN